MTLLGDPCKSTLTNTGPNDGSTSPVEQVNQRLKQFVSSLKPTINTLCTMAVTIKNIGNLISTGISCTPSCRLGIPNPPVVLTRAWNECLTECGKQITAINYHSECHQNMLQDIQDTINREFQKISSEFQANVPELDSKLKYTKTEISALIESREQQMLNSRKRGPRLTPTILMRWLQPLTRGPEPRITIPPPYNSR